MKQSREHVFLSSACRPLSAGALAVAVSFVVGCSSSTGTGGSNLDEGSIATDPTTGRSFVVTANRGGGAPGIGIERVFWGRVVDVFDTEAATGVNRLQFQDFVIGDNIVSNGVDYRLERSPVTEKETLTILHEAGTASYQTAFGKLSKDTQPLLDKSDVDLPPYSAVARNAVIVFEFDDLLDHSTINAKTLPVTVGYPPAVPFEVRIVPDMSHGDLADADGDGIEEFHTTRVIVDPTVSTIEALESNPPLPVNSLGFPAAQVTDQPNVLIRIPTVPNTAIGQFAVLRNLGGSALTLSGNGSSNSGSPTLDVVRAFRSRGSAVGDDNNGFLPDEVPPEIIGVQSINILDITSVGEGAFEMDFDFQTVACTTTPDVGDVIELPDHLVEVVERSNPPGNGQVRAVRVALLSGDPSTYILFRGLSEFKTTFDPSGAAPPACFVRYSIEPTNPPDVGVNPQASISVLFSEPMDPASVQAFDSFKIRRTGNPDPFESRIVGRVEPSLDLRGFTFRPTVPLTHTEGLSESYILDLAAGSGGTIDLAGNPIKFALLDPETGEPPEFGLDPNQPTFRTNGVSFKYDSQDEDGNDAPEIRGQFLYDLARGVVKPRPVNRFSAVADQSQPVVGAMIPFTQGIQTPLSNWGSKLQYLWRYHDVGFGLTDENTMNLDLEFLAWAPFGGVQTDSFGEFRVAVAHSFFLPDEVVDPNLLPVAPFSGLQKVFDDNLLSSTEDPLSVIHSKPSGYIIRPLDVFVSTTGTNMMPWPVNRDPIEGTPLPVAERKTFTWRDTGKVSVGGPPGNGNGGVDTRRFRQVTNGGQLNYYPADFVPTIGLPLLMEFRCYPDEGAFGLNGFRINLALNSSARPNFRAYSTGGILASGVPQIIDPDNEPIARGGIDPSTGQPTQPGREVDNTFYMGQGDFVVRMNRIHSIWFEAEAGSTQFALPVLEPSPSLQPLGTSVSVAFRGCVSFTPASDPLEIADSRTYDFYGNPIVWQMGPSNWAVSEYVNGDPSWKASPAEINGASFFQYRVTLASNTDSTLTPELAGLGIAYSY